jgi:hypothetical protein
LKERLIDASDEEIRLIANLVSFRFPVPPPTNDIIQIQKGVNGARSDDTKTMKSAIIDWITPPGQTLNPALSRKVKVTRGFHHERTGALLCPAGLDWNIPQ